jgi:hypothetical protein
MASSIAILRERERLDNIPRVAEFGFARGKDTVGRFDLRGVNQGLAIEPEHPALLALH